MSMKSEIPADFVYGSIRQEILDQKKCQFQLFAMVITVNSGILAFSAATEIGPLLYVAPMILNLFALIIILDKAISIQRKVGYLQMMEQHYSEVPWTWETHLDLFRITKGVKWKPSSEKRNHSYITTITLMFATLNFMFAGLCWWGPASSISSRQMGWLDAGVFVLLFATLCLGFVKRQSLVHGENSMAAIIAKWKEVIWGDNKKNDKNAS